MIKEVPGGNPLEKAFDTTIAPSTVSGEPAAGGAALDDNKSLSKTVGLLDGISLVIGSLIGAGFFVIPGIVFELVGPAGGVVAWAVGGLIALTGALCYGELSTLLVSAGSETTYLSKAFGDVCSFCYVFMLFFVVGTGAIAAIANVCATYVMNGFGYDTLTEGNLVQFIAIGLVMFLIVLNVAGTSHVFVLQYILLAVKVVAVVGIVIAACVYPFVQKETPTVHTLDENFLEGFQASNMASSVIAVLFVFNGFQLLSSMSEEMVNPGRDVPRIFLSGITSVTIVGLMVFVAYLSALPPNIIVSMGKQVASEFFRQVGGDVFQSVACICIALCAAGSANANVIGCSRIFYSAARDGMMPSALKRISSRNVPDVSIVVTGIWSIVILLLVPDLQGILQYFMTGQILVFALTGAALMRLRWTMPSAKRDYKVSLYPVTPIVFIGSCVAVIVYSVATSTTSRISILLSVVGVPVWYTTKYARRYLRGDDDDDVSRLSVVEVAQTQ